MQTVLRIRTIQHLSCILQNIFDCILYIFKWMKGRKKTQHWQSLVSPEESHSTGPGKIAADWGLDSSSEELKAVCFSVESPTVRTCNEFSHIAVDALIANLSHYFLLHEMFWKWSSAAQHVVEGACHAPRACIAPQCSFLAKSPISTIYLWSHLLNEFWWKNVSAGSPWPYTYSLIWEVSAESFTAQSTLRALTPNTLTTS